MVSSVETSLFRPRIYLVWVLGALEALQCIICHYLWTELRTELLNHGIREAVKKNNFQTLDIVQTMGGEV